MNRIPIALFANRSEAEPIQQRLARAGVDAEIQDELMLQKLWFVSKEARISATPPPRRQASDLLRMAHTRK